MKNKSARLNWVKTEYQRNYVMKQRDNGEI